MEKCPECGKDMRYNSEISYDLKGNYYYCQDCNMNYEIPIRGLNNGRK